MVLDAEIERSVISALLSNERLYQTAIDVGVEAGVVRLRGRTHSAAERVLAMELAGGVPGVRGVVNELSVRTTAGRTDEEVGTDVCAALARDPLLVDSVVDVAVRDGVVHLRGLLTSYLAKWHAEKAAREVPGVAKVVTDIAVIPLPLRDDSEMASEVLAVLAAHQRVELDRISVDVDEGIVHLRGEVSSQEQRWLVEELAASVAGVWEVVNELVVVPRQG